MIIDVHPLTLKLDDISCCLSLPRFLRIRDKLLREALRESVLSFLELNNPPFLEFSLAFYTLM